MAVPGPAAHLLPHAPPSPTAAAGPTAVLPRPPGKFAAAGAPWAGAAPSPAALAKDLHAMASTSVPRDQGAPLPRYDKYGVPPSPQQQYTLPPMDLNRQPHHHNNTNYHHVHPGHPHTMNAPSAPPPQYGAERAYYPPPPSPPAPPHQHQQQPHHHHQQPTSHTQPPAPHAPTAAPTGGHAYYAQQQQQHQQQQHAPQQQQPQPHHPHHPHHANAHAAAYPPPYHHHHPTNAGPPPPAHAYARTPMAGPAAPPAPPPGPAGPEEWHLMDSLAEMLTTVHDMGRTAATLRARLADGAPLFAAVPPPPVLRRLIARSYAAVQTLLHVDAAATRTEWLRLHPPGSYAYTQVYGHLDPWQYAPHPAELHMNGVAGEDDDDDGDDHDAPPPRAPDVPGAAAAAAAPVPPPPAPVSPTPPPPPAPVHFTLAGIHDGAMSDHGDYHHRHHRHPYDNYAAPTGPSPPPPPPPMPTAGMHAPQRPLAHPAVPAAPPPPMHAAAAGDKPPVRRKRAAPALGDESVALPPQPKKRSKAGPPPGGCCHSCSASDTPEWRRGPDGKGTLCNACGLHWAKLRRQRHRMREASLEAIDAEFSAVGQAARGRNPRPTREQFLRRRVQQEMASEWARHAGGHEGADAEDPVLEEDEDGSLGP